MSLTRRVFSLGRHWFSTSAFGPGLTEALERLYALHKMRFLNQNAAAIQALTAVLITFLTGWLIYWSRRYTRTSERVALIMERDIEIRTMPYLRLLCSTSRNPAAPNYWSLRIEILNDSQGTAIVSSALIKAKCAVSGTQLTLETEERLSHTPFSIRPGGSNIAEGKAAINSAGHSHVGNCQIELFGELIYSDLIGSRSWKLTVSQDGKASVETFREGRVIQF